MQNERISQMRLDGRRRWRALDEGIGRELSKYFLGIIG